ncbi:hypothetical protein RT717_03865 [Imperialibacter roseus]|uniref:Uncharacterized protein n=1 Tax=Imperialibacter roseus TaxID=1324217 RepID=A0ABZ0ITP7_9BACT|nr:hypothetical protein [Imperialibacter roseus]WOK07760.1 hypothetical protein RT717_03865 [Imperialibacter roseus]
MAKNYQTPNLTEAEYILEIKKIDLVLKDKVSNVVSCNESEYWFGVEPINNDDQCIWIQYESKEIRVGIGPVYEVFDDKSEGQELINGVRRFIQLLTNPINVISHYRGDFKFRADYYLMIKSNQELIGTSLTWLYPFWQRKSSKSQIQSHIISPTELSYF